MAKTEENGNHSAVKTPKTLMSEVNYKQTPQTEKDKMTTLVERYQNLDPVRIVEFGDKVIKFCISHGMCIPYLLSQCAIRPAIAPRHPPKKLSVVPATYNTARALMAGA